MKSYRDLISLNFEVNEVYRRRLMLFYPELSFQHLQWAVVEIDKMNFSNK